MLRNFDTLHSNRHAAKWNAFNASEAFTAHNSMERKLVFDFYLNFSDSQNAFMWPKRKNIIENSAQHRCFLKSQKPYESRNMKWINSPWDWTHSFYSTHIAAIIVDKESIIQHFISEQRCSLVNLYFGWINFYAAQIWSQ